MTSFEGLRVQIASDLHLEFYDELPPFTDLLVPSAPVLALLGDVSALGHPRGRKLYEQFLGECCERFEVILVLVGNHEFYSDSVSKCTSGQILAYLYELAAASEKLQVLENQGLTLEGVRVIGTALWSNVPNKQTVAGASAMGVNPNSTVERCMNDYRLIYVEGGGGASTEALAGGNPREARVRDTNAWHCSAVEFLEREAREATAQQMNVLVLTHHTPTFRGTSHPRHNTDPQGMSSAFSTDLEHMLQDPAMLGIHTWCFGHTHYNSDQHVCGVRLVSNQMGYCTDPTLGYRRSLVVSVPSAFADRQLEQRRLDRAGAEPQRTNSCAGVCSLV
mmetsp:Transcript_68996/g.173799  ORF Transcript_68996/g.173799 Transcript_68996/m.173799 type:complete len:334 (-) Transcript_68996:173-1174(-)|eukprot:CAMPEP_0115444358 /NCGR_PEP_ID=MMETSP0271-20121206/38356_1 /TAXON_ID=71861 /ORGANISM="Scrippsiella trochoidea, Strain CCMP3099" /LENGTH=333 /DNA_ID=CAMNT_0002870289 /DNA_START=70 /DNA_END=1071 /DNA_ORIENTATION=+